MNSLGIADVTPGGIIFKSLVYSCPEANTNQWFEAALKSGGWKVIVVYTKSNLNQILCYDFLNERWLICNVVEKGTASDDKLNKYFLSIQKLIEARHQNKKGQRNRKTPKDYSPVSSISICMRCSNFQKF